MQSEAVNLAADLRVDADGGEALGLCLFDERWHQGVIGLVAGRIKDRLHRPVIAFARAEDGSLRGSARSIAGVHIRDALDSIATRHPGLVGKFGGHALAAGLTLDPGALEPFRAAFAAEIALRADADSLADVVFSDGELAGHELCVETAQLLRSAGPWGQGFPEPLFDGTFNVVDLRVVGANHLKLKLEPLEVSGSRPDPRHRAERAIDAIAFGYVGGVMEDPAVRCGSRLQAAYRLELNEYRGTESVQLNCQHLKPL